MSKVWGAWRFKAPLRALLSSHLHEIEILTYKGQWFRLSDRRPQE